MVRLMSRTLTTLIAVALMLSACGDLRLAGGVSEGQLDVRQPEIVTVDEFGAEVADFTLTLSDGSVHEPTGGPLELELTTPVAGVVDSPGFLSAPVVVDPEADRVEVKLWRKVGPSGAVRTSLHFGGDTMLARRFLDSGFSDLAPTELGPEVVDAIDEIFSSADYSTLNLESVVGDLPEESQTAGKRWTIQSPPEIVTMLRSLGADLAVLGNNHITDWDDAGVTETMRTLERGGIPHVGAGLEVADAVRPHVERIDGLEVATLSFLRTDGGFNNDYLPLTGDDRLRDADPRLDWQYESRQIEVVGPRGRLEGRVRAGDAWAWFNGQDFESPEGEAEAWNQLETTFPELQDSLARRDHGGPAQFTAENLQLGMSHLEGEEDVVIVQIHGGLQYVQAPPMAIQEAARAAIDAGADLAIVHHAHAFSGFEYYNGGLIAWGLGNLVFDQNLFVTYGSGIVRIVLEEGEIIETSVVPMSLVGYRPVPVTGAPAEELVTRIGVRSRSETYTRLAQWGDAIEIPWDRPPSSVQVELRSDGLIEIRDAEPIEVTAEIGQDGTLAVPPGHVVVGGLPDSMSVGVELFGWGSFDQVLANGVTDRAPQWAMDDAQGFIWSAEHRDGHLVYDPSLLSGVGRVRPVSRLPIVQSRLYDPEERPLQAAPRIEIGFEATASWLTSLELRIDAYHFSDRNPARYPVNEKLDSVEYEATIGRSATVDFSVDLPPDLLRDAETGLEATAMMIYLQDPSTRLGTLEIDDFRVVEWRRAADLPPGLWFQATFVEGPPGAKVPLVDLRG